MASYSLNFRYFSLHWTDMEFWVLQKPLKALDTLVQGFSCKEILNKSRTTVLKLSSTTLFDIP